MADSSGEFPGKQVADNIVELGKVNQPLLSISVILIYLYLMVYVFYEAYNEIDRADEDFINCSCHGKDMRFYRAIFYLFSSFWLIAVLIWTVLGCLNLIYVW